jgi:hypothetical protein
MGFEMAAKLSCWLVSVMRVAVIMRMPWSRGTSESSHQRDLRKKRRCFEGKEEGWPVVGPLDSQCVASWVRESRGKRVLHEYRFTWHQDAIQIQSLADRFDFEIPLKLGDV